MIKKTKDPDIISINNKKEFFDMLLKTNDSTFTFIPEELENKDEKEELQPLSPAEIYDYLCKYVIGQDDAKKALSVVASNHQAICMYNQEEQEDKIRKSNILIMGPSGSGKTLLIETLSRCLDVPFVSSSATEYSSTGYIGKDVDSTLLSLVDQAQGNINLAENGIIFIDEVDKVCAKNTSSTKDVNGKGVQHSLLRIIEGAVVKVQSPRDYSVTIDTSNILFIFGGSFQELMETMKKESLKNPLGFGPNDSPVREKVKIDISNLIDYGMITEFAGRLNHIVTTNKLSRDELLQVLTEPQNSLVDQHEKLLKFKQLSTRGLRTKKFLESVVDEAWDQGTGARGLKTILEKKLTDKYFKG